jgi:hypothetical protein
VICPSCQSETVRVNKSENVYREMCELCGWASPVIYTKGNLAIVLPLGDEHAAGCALPGCGIVGTGQGR